MENAFYWALLGVGAVLLFTAALVIALVWWVYLLTAKIDAARRQGPEVLRDCNGRPLRERV